MLGVVTSIWSRALAGKGAGNGGNPPVEATPIHSLNLTTAPSASNAFDGYGLATSRTVTDYNGRIVEIPANAVPMGGLRPVRNLWPTADGSDTPSTQVITVESGRVYQLRIGAESASGATAACSGAFTGTLTGDGADIQAFDTGKTATTTSLTVTITGSVRKIQLQDITHRADLSTAPDEYVSTADDYGTGVNGFRYFDTELANTVASNVVTEATGDSIEGWGDWQPGATNKAEDNLQPDISSITATLGTPVLSVVAETTDYPPALEGMGNGNVYRVDNSAQGAAARIRCLATFNSVENHSLQVWARSDAAGATFGVYGSDGDAADVPVGTEYTHLKVENQTVSSSWKYLGFYVPAGAVVEFIGQQAEEGAVCTALIPTGGAVASRPAMSPAPTISGLAGTEDARLTVTGLAADLVTPDPTDTTERTLDVDNTDGEFDTLPSPIKVLSIDVYNDGERPA